MTLLSLEDFSHPSPHADPVAPPPDPAVIGDAERAAAHDLGYQAGWDDAAKAQAEERSRIDAEFARNLQELSFTFHEARAHVIASMAPLVRAMTESLMPALIADTLAQRVEEELRPLIEQAADAPVDLMVAPGGAELLQQAVADCAAGSVTLREEPSLAAGQIYLRVGKAEREIDLSGALERIREAASALYTLNERTLKNA